MECSILIYESFPFLVISLIRTLLFESLYTFSKRLIESAVLLQTEKARLLFRFFVNRLLIEIIRVVAIAYPLLWDYIALCDFHDAKIIHIFILRKYFRNYF